MPTSQAQSQHSEILGSQQHAATGSCVAFPLSLGSWELLGLIWALWIIHGRQRLRVKGCHRCVSDISPQAWQLCSQAGSEEPGIWCMPALQRVEREDHKFTASLGYIATPFRSRQVSPLAILYYPHQCTEGRVRPGGSSDWKPRRSSVGRVSLPT